MPNLLQGLQGTALIQNQVKTVFTVEFQHVLMYFRCHLVHAHVRVRLVMSLVLLVYDLCGSGPMWTSAG